MFFSCRDGDARFWSASPVMWKRFFLWEILEIERIPQPGPQSQLEYHRWVRHKQEWYLSSEELNISVSEAEILASDSFQLGKDIEKFYELHQQLSMDDLARRKVMHTKVHLVRVLSKVIRNLERPAELDTYLRCIGRLHQLAGVDSSYLSMSGKSFCEALDSIEQHKELWSKQVSQVKYKSHSFLVQNCNSPPDIR